MSVTAPLTSVQRWMFIMQSGPVYRVPVVFDMNDGRADDEVRHALRAALAASPTLCARYGYDATRDEFFQVYDPELADGIEIVDAGSIADAADLDGYCRRRCHMPDLASGAPLTARLLRVGGRRVLHLEFHHIAMDGVGIALFERLLAGSPAPGHISDPAEAFAVYDEVAAKEQAAEWIDTERFSLAPFLPPAAGQTAGPATVGRESVRIDAAGIAALRRAAARHRVFPRVLLQAAFEESLARFAPGSRYSCVTNWRWSIARREAIGSFPALVDRPVGEPASLRSRIDALVTAHGSPLVCPEHRLDDRPTVVFSHEQLGFDSCRFIPADEYPRFELYLRVVVDHDECLVEAEYDRRVVVGSIAKAVVEDVAAASRSKEETP